MPRQHRRGSKQAFAARLRFADKVQLRIRLDGAAYGCAALNIVMDKKYINPFYGRVDEGARGAMVGGGVISGAGFELSAGTG